MEENSRLSAQVKKITQELIAHKIELQQTRGYLQCILQNSTDLIFVTDVEGILVSFSRGGEKILGYKWEEVAGRAMKDFAEDPVAFERLRTASDEEGDAVGLDIRFRHKEGKGVYCNASLMGLTNREGQGVGTLGICQDITLWKKLQEDLIRVDRLAEIGRIAAGVAHEINNPLAIISEASGWAYEVIEETKGLSGQDRRALLAAIAKIGDQTKRCRNITDGLLDFARDSAPARNEFDIHELLKQTIEFLRHEFKRSFIKVVFDFAGEPLVLNSDPRLLEQVFANLNTNAIHSIQRKGAGNGRVEIRTVKAGSNIEISVTDNGVGISDEDQKKVFELFYTTKPPGKGTGLGLPICENIVKKLGGDITFHSEPGVGATFTIRLPLS